MTDFTIVTTHAAGEDDVQGYLNCTTAAAVRDAYVAAANVMLSVGGVSTANYFRGIATGYIRGSCPR